MRIVLDTHVLIYWCSGSDLLSRAQRRALTSVSEANPALVSDITLWEIAVLSAGGRLELDRPLSEWLDRATAAPLARVVPITSRVAAEIAALNEWDHRDPADRIIVATARAFGAELLTNDRRIRESGKVPVV